MLRPHIAGQPWTPRCGRTSAACPPHMSGYTRRLSAAAATMEAAGAALGMGGEPTWRIWPGDLAKNIAFPLAFPYDLFGTYYSTGSPAQLINNRARCRTKSWRGGVNLLKI